MPRAVVDEEELIMERAGRVLERVVASIEAAIDGGVARIQSPAFIEGKISGSKREVDVAV